MSFDGFSANSSDFVFVVMLGLWIGAIIGCMAEVLPYQVLVFVSVGFAMAAWRVEGDMTFHMFAMMGLLIGSAFGAFDAIIPYGVFVFLALVFGIMLWRNGTTNQRGESGLNSLIAIPLLIIISVGLFINFTYADFCGVGVPGSVGDVCANPANWVNGFPTIYTGCFSDCTLTAFNIFGSSIFSNFVLAASNGDYFGMIASFFGAAFQSTAGLFTVLTVAIAGLLILLGSGIGFTAQLLASGGAISINEAGTRLYQSMGISLLIFGLAFGLWGGWLVGGSSFTGGFFGGVYGTIASAAFFILLLTMYFYGAYAQGRQIAK